MNTLIYGNGYLSSHLSPLLNAQILSNKITTESDLEDEHIDVPDVIVNMVGKTGRPNVDWCESHKEETYFANVTLVRMMAEHAKRHGIRLVHVSSGCIYEGDNHGKGWTEEDSPNFERSFYSFTKAEAERILADYDNVLIVRPRMPIAGIPHARNLINKLLGYQEIIVVPNSITVIEDMCASLVQLITHDMTGVYNMTNPTPLTHKDILDIFEQLSGVSLHKTYITPDDLRVRAPRSNTILNTEKLSRTMLGMPSAPERLISIMTEYIKHPHPFSEHTIS